VKTLVMEEQFEFGVDEEIMVTNPISFDPKVMHMTKHCFLL
jgi:hypothetical protein